MRFLLAATTAALVTFLASSPSAFAFCRTTTVATDPSFSPTDGKCWDQGIFVYHSRTCVGYAVESPGSSKLDMTAFRGLVETAFQTWETSSCGAGGPTIDAQFVGATSRSALGYDTKGGSNASAIVFWDDTWPNGSANEVILTTLTFNKETGEILDADMEVNTAEIAFSLADPVPPNGTDMQSALTHEVGHFFGIAHSPDRTATMFAKYTPGSTFFRDLTDDDVGAMCSIYLPGNQRQTSKGKVEGGACDTSAPPPPTSTAGDGGCNATGSDSLAASTLPLVALGLVLTGLQKRRLRKRVRR